MEFLVFFVLKHRPGGLFARNMEMRSIICNRKYVGTVVPGTKRAVRTAIASEIEHTPF
jgi:hypothetical protein